MNRKGFTLVELAIVIVIIGLIVSGVLGAQSLINSSNRQSTIKTIIEMDKAIRAFELEFDTWPGKMKNGYEYFGSACGTNNNNSVTGCHTEDFDKCIDTRSEMCDITNGKLAGDIRRIYVDLAVSGIVPDLKSTITSANDEACINNTINEAAIGGHHMFSSRKTNHKLFLHFANLTYAGNVGASCTYNVSTAYLPATVKFIDEKIDNGNAITGKITTQYFYRGVYNTGYLSPNCHDDSGVYNVSNQDKDCGFAFQLK